MTKTLDAALKTKIRQLHASGYSPRQISERIRINLAMTRIFMNRLGLGAVLSNGIERKQEREVPAIPADYATDHYRYDAPGQVVIEVRDVRVTPCRPVSIFTVSSLY